MAAACAEYIHADRLIYMTDVAGVLDGSKVLKAVSCAEVEDLIRQHKVSGGMVLKLEACKRALSAGVSQVRIVGGTTETRLAFRGQWRERAGHARDAGLSRRGRSEALSTQAQDESEESSDESAKLGQRTAAAGRAAMQRCGALSDEHLPAAADGVRARRGCYLYDQHGKKYLDFLGGIAVNALGYAHPRLVRVMRREAGARRARLESVSPSLPRAAGAQAGAIGRGMDRVFFTNSGTEADRRRAQAGAAGGASSAARQGRRAFWRWRIRFTGGPLARFRLPIRRNIASRLRRWCPAWSLCA